MVDIYALHICDSNLWIISDLSRWIKNGHFCNRIEHLGFMKLIKEGINEAKRNQFMNRLSTHSKLGALLTFSSKLIMILHKGLASLYLVWAESPNVILT